MTSSIGPGIYGPDATGIRAAPRIVVGNALAGDSSSEVDFLDTGNCAGLNAAIIAANAGPYDVWVRPGTLDLSLVGAPAILTSPADGVRIRGAGKGLVTIRSQAVGEQRIWRITNDRIEISGFTFFLQDGDGTGVLNDLVVLDGNECRLEDCEFAVDPLIDPNNTAVTHLLEIGGDFNQIVKCFGGHLGQNLPGFNAVSGADLTAFFCDEITDFVLCRVWGADIAYILGGGRAVDCESRSSNRIGFQILGGTNAKLITPEIHDAPEIGIQVLAGGTDLLISSPRLSLNPGAIGIEINGDRTQIEGGAIDEVTIGIDCYSDNNQIEGINIEASATGIVFNGGSDNNIEIGAQINAPTPIDDLGFNNDISHNQP